MEKKAKVNLAVYNPFFLMLDQEKNFHGYNFVFLKKYVSSIFVSNPKLYFRLKKRLEELGIQDKKFIFTIAGLNQKAHALVGFSGIPYSGKRKLVNYKGLKAFHTLDYVMYPEECNAYLEKNKVDYVIAHTDLGKNSSFFRDFYPSYHSRVIALPFGYGKRFHAIKPFHNRIKKAVALGAVNPLKDPLCTEQETKAFVTYFHDDTYTHRLRRYIQLNESFLSNIIDCRLPAPEKQKDFSYNPVKVLNDYQIFVNDEGLMNFPPARTYEGIACGCVMLASDNPVFSDFGFIPDVNYISFPLGNYEEMKEKLRYYLINQDALNKIRDKSLEFASGFTHEHVADMLYKNIIDKLGGIV